MLRALEACGPDGARARDFARKYFPQVTGPRVKVAGRFLAHLGRQGFAFRVGARGDAALHQLTDAGRAYIAGFWKRAQLAAPAAEQGPVAALQAPQTPGDAGRYGQGW